MTNFDHKPSPEEGRLLTDNRALVHCIEVENHNGGIPYGQVEATGTSFVAITGDTLDSSTINQEMDQIVWHYEKDAPVDLAFLYCRKVLGHHLDTFLPNPGEGHRKPQCVTPSERQWARNVTPFPSSDIRE